MPEGMPLKWKVIDSIWSLLIGVISTNLLGFRPAITVTLATASAAVQFVYLLVSKRPADKLFRAMFYIVTVGCVSVALLCRWVLGPAPDVYPLYAMSGALLGMAVGFFVPRWQLSFLIMIGAGFVYVDLNTLTAGIVFAAAGILAGAIYKFLPVALGSFVEGADEAIGHFTWHG